MLVDARHIHLVSAEQKLAYVRSGYLVPSYSDLVPVWVLVNRLRTAAQLLYEAADHLRLAATKR